MAIDSQRKASTAHRQRAKQRGLVRLEVQAPKADGQLIRALAETLRGAPERADAVRAKLREALALPRGETAFDIFGSELPDDVFDGVFETTREPVWQDRDL